MTALYTAVYEGLAGMTATLLAAGADVNATTDNGSTALQQAAAGNPGASGSEIVQLLIAAGADVCAADSSGTTSLHVAVAYSNDNNMVQMLLNAGAAVNAADVHGRTALHEATARAADEQMLQQLPAAGADVHAVDSLGHTALHLAAKTSSEKVVQLLLIGGANPAAATLSGLTVLEYAICRAQQDSCNIMRLLIQAHDAPVPVLQRVASVAADHSKYNSLGVLVRELRRKDAAAAEAVVAAMPEDNLWKAGWLAAKCEAEVAVQQQRAAFEAESAAEKQEIEIFRVAVQHLVVGLARMAKNFQQLHVGRF